MDWGSVEGILSAAVVLLPDVSNATATLSIWTKFVSSPCSGLTVTWRGASWKNVGGKWKRWKLGEWCVSGDQEIEYGLAFGAWEEEGGKWGLNPWGQEDSWKSRKRGDLSEHGGNLDPVGLTGSLERIQERRMSSNNDIWTIISLQVHHQN